MTDGSDSFNTITTKDGYGDGYRKNGYGLNIASLLNSSISSHNIPEENGNYQSQLDDQQSPVSNLPAANLVERLLQWSILETNGLLDSFTFFRLDDVIADTISLLSRMANPKGVQILFEPNSAAIVYANQEVIGTMAQSLVANAVMFSQVDGTVKISSKVERDVVKISIFNFGVRLSENQLHQLFQVEANFNLLNLIDEMGVGMELLLCHRFAGKTTPGDR